MELQRKLERAPFEIERLRWDILKKYGKKIEEEGKAACPTETMKDSVKVAFLPNGDFKIKHNIEASQYIRPIIKKSTQEMRNEIVQQISEILK